MPLFGLIRLPRTSYGYRPPRKATARGWACTNRQDCGASEHERVRRWPARCRQCKSRADPVFGPPWDHEALGVELNWQIQHDTDEYGPRFARERLMTWRLKDALLRRDAADGAAARTALHRYVAEQAREAGRRSPTFTLGLAVHQGLDAGDFDGAAQDLGFWLSLSTGEGAATEDDIRINAKSVISAATAFLDGPAGSTHPQAAEIRAGCLRVAEGAFPELNRDQQAAVMQMARD